MKALTTIIILVIIITTQLFSQFRLGVTTSIGKNFTTQEAIFLSNLDNVINYELEHIYQSATTGFGLAFLYTQDLVWIQSRPTLTRTSHEYMLDDHANRSLEQLSDEQISVTLPIVAGAIIRDFFRVGAGPVFQKTLEAGDSFLSMPSFTMAKKKLVDTGFQFVIGTDFFDRFFLDAIFTQGLNKTGEEYAYMGRGVEYKGRTRTLSLALSLYL